MKMHSSKSKMSVRPAKKTLSKKHVGLKSDSQSREVSALILQDHKPIKELVLILKDSDGSIAKKRPAFAEFERLLSSHAKAEEESLYIHLKQVDHLRPEGLEGDTEHAIADRLMREVNESKGDDDLWMAKVKVLAELVDHHLKEEETEMLKKLPKDLTSEKRIEIGKLYSKLLNKYREEDSEPKKSSAKNRLIAFLGNSTGKVAVPILLYFLGVPGIVVILLWALFFRG